MEKSGISFATVNRWENAHCELSQIAVNAIKNLRAEHDIDSPQLEGTSIITPNKTVTLYHGFIAPSRQDLCDFGRGFYMGTERI